MLRLEAYESARWLIWCIVTYIIIKLIILESSFLEEGELLIHIFLLRLTTSSLMNFLYSFYTFLSSLLLYYSILYFSACNLLCSDASFHLFKKTDVSKKSHLLLSPKLPAWWSLLKFSRSCPYVLYPMLARLYFLLLFITVESCFGPRDKKLTN